MERKIGEIFGYDGRNLRVMIADNDNCYGCHLFGRECWREEVIDDVGFCFGLFRNDRTSVKFIPLRNDRSNRE